jgi:hypothetical protein
MTLDTNTQLLVRATTIPNYQDSSESQAQMNQRGETLVAQGLPELAEVVRQGNSWQVIGAAMAALTAVPTSTAGHSVWNGEADTGKCYFIDSFGCVEIVTDATQQNSLALFAAMEPGKVAAPTDAAITRFSLSGRPINSSASRTSTGATTTAGSWTPHAPSAPGATAFAGGVWRVHECQVRGLYMVRPGGLFSVHAAKTVATATQLRFFIRWHEVQCAYA